jgi:hypothetical protein
LARPSGRRPNRRRAGRTRAWRDCPQRDCEPGRTGSGRGVDSARVRLAEDRRLVDAGRRRSSRRACGGHGLSLTAASRSGDRASRAKADRRSSSEHGERTGHPSLAMAGARCVGRRWPAFLFLVDDEPDTARSRRKGAGTYDARAGDRRTSAIPASCSFASGTGARPAASAPDCRANAGPNPAASTAAPCTCSCSFERSTSDSSAGFASAAGNTSARHTDVATDDRTGACNPGSCGSRNR